MATIIIGLIGWAIYSWWSNSEPPSGDEQLPTNYNPGPAYDHTPSVYYGGKK